MLGSCVTAYLNQQNKNILSLGKNELTITENHHDMMTRLREIITENSTVINCIGAIPQKEFDSYDMIFLNSQLPLMLAMICEEKNAWLIHPSTDCVFSGEVGRYSVENVPDPKDMYGISKLQGEIFSPHVMIVRSSIIGVDRKNVSLLGWLMKNRGKAVNGYTNHFWNGMTCLQWIKEVLNLGFVAGITHFYSRSSYGDVCSKYELLEMINKSYNLGITISPVKTETTVDRSLIGTPAMIPLEQQIDEMKEFDLL